MSGMDDMLDGLFSRDAAEAPPPPLPEGTFGAVGVKWSKYAGAHRPCDDCVALVHQLGVAGAPAPGPARSRRKGPNGDTFLCHDHAEQRKRLDGQAEKARLERLAVAEHMSRGR